MIKIKKYSLSESLFYISYIVYLIYMILSSTFYSNYVYPLGNILLAISFFLLFIKELLLFSVNKKDIILLIIITATAAIFYKYWWLSIAVVPFFIYSARNVNIKNIIELSYRLSLILLLFVFFSSKLGIIENFVESGLRQREYLGFLYSLYPSALVCNIVFLKIYLDKEKISWKVLVGLFILSFITYIYTDSRLTFILAVVAIVISMLLKKSDGLRKAFRNRWLISSYIIASLGSLYFTLRYDYLSSWQSSLNEILGGRLSLGRDTLEYYGVGMFGKRINLVGNGLDGNGEYNTSSSYDYVDNLYAQLLLRTGILFFIFFVAIMTYVTYKSYVQRDTYLLIIFALLALHGIIDDLIIQPQYNTFWLVILAVVFGNLKVKEKTE